MAPLLILAALLGLAAQTQAASGTSQGTLVLKTIPATPLIELGRDQQFLNFDVAIQNKSGTTMRLRRIDLEVFDADGSLISRRVLDENGFPSGMETLPERDASAHGVLGLFNPFYGWPLRADIARMRYTLTFSAQGAPNQSASVSVAPQVYHDKTALMLPLKGRLFVLDGHDFYSHHRRQDIALPEAARAGVTANPVRYADDFVFVDAHGAMYRGDPREKKNWFGYGQPVYAPAGGTVAAVVDDVGEASWDGKHLHIPKLPADASPFGLGNYIIIDHGDGEFSALLHLIPHSIRVRKGEQVAQGMIVGLLGTSDAGDGTYAVEPHLHYCLMRGANVPASEGLPAYFESYTLLLGQQEIPVTNAPVDSGDFFRT